MVGSAVLNIAQKYPAEKYLQSGGSSNTHRVVLDTQNGYAIDGRLPPPCPLYINARAKQALCLARQVLSEVSAGRASQLRKLEPEVFPYRLEDRYEAKIHQGSPEEVCFAIQFKDGYRRDYYGLELVLISKPFSVQLNIDVPRDKEHKEPLNKALQDVLNGIRETLKNQLDLKETALRTKDFSDLDLKAVDVLVRSKLTNWTKVSSQLFNKHMLIPSFEESGESSTTEINLAFRSESSSLFSEQEASELRIEANNRNGSFTRVILGGDSTDEEILNGALLSQYQGYLESIFPRQYRDPNEPYYGSLED